MSISELHMSLSKTHWQSMARSKAGQALASIVTISELKRFQMRANM
jgi:hypothetical protein